MAGTDSTRNFEAMIASYEENGWEVRTINHAALRATVRIGATIVEAGSQVIPVTAANCRKLWVDGTGEVQETTVPC